MNNTKYRGKYMETRDLQQDLHDTYGADDLFVHETPEFEAWELAQYFKPPEDLKDQILTQAEFNAKYGRNTKQPKDDGFEPGAI